VTTGDGNDVFWDSGWQSGAAAPAPQQPAILPANPVSSSPPSIAIGANAATGGSMSAKQKLSFGGPKHPVALAILVVVAIGLVIGNVALVNASNAYVPWSEV